MNKEQKNLLARAVEISAFAQFGAIGWEAYKDNSWIYFSISLVFLLYMILAAYVILGIKSKEGE